MTSQIGRRLEALEAARHEDFPVLFVSWQTPGTRLRSTEWRGVTFTQDADEKEDAFQARVTAVVRRNAPPGNNAAVLWLGEIDARL